MSAPAHEPAEKISNGYSHGLDADKRRWFARSRIRILFSKGAVMGLDCVIS